MNTAIYVSITDKKYNLYKDEMQHTGPMIVACQWNTEHTHIYMYLYSKLTWRWQIWNIYNIML